MLILINGLPHFSRTMAKDLNEFDANNKYVFLNTYQSKWAQLKFILLLPFSSAVISMNGVSDRSKSLDWVIRMKKKLIMQWQGTDVELAVERNKDGSIYRKYIDYATHFISSSWFKEELKEVIENVTFAPFSYVKEVGNDTVYDEVSVISYIAKGREEFYGWNEIIALANAQSSLKITIVGTDGVGLKFPANMNCLGWVDEERFHGLLKENAIFVRLTDHDGKSISVAQALAFGCEVIWTYEFEGCYTIEKNKEQLIDKVILLQKLINERGKTPNGKNINFAEDKLKRDSVMTNYTAIFKKEING